MKQRKIEDALGEISPRHIAEAAGPVKKKRTSLPWIGAIAAVLALVLTVSFLKIPVAVEAGAVSLAQPRTDPRPDWEKYEDMKQYDADIEAWLAREEAREATAKEALQTMSGFFRESTGLFLAGEGNQLYSPINACIGLSMAAELTAGNTRQQLLDALGVSDIEALARYISTLWEAAYYENGKEVCTLASALWLDDKVDFHQSAMDTLAHDYYVSVYRQDLQSSQALSDIQDWLNSNTGGHLKDSVQNIQLPELAVLALYSTIYFQGKWADEFQAAGNTPGPFHAPGGDVTATYMKKLSQMQYHWGDSFGAVALGLKNGSRMWFILPDPDKTTADVLAEGQYMDMILGEWENSKYVKVNLSVPKFDIQATKDLREGLAEMGITDMFQFGEADFSSSLKVPAAFSAANQAVRVAIDETGVTASAYIELPAAGTAPPPKEIIDFILDRPFLFVIADYSGIPLFAGTVAQP